MPDVLLATELTRDHGGAHLDGEVPACAAEPCRCPLQPTPLLLVGLPISCGLKRCDERVGDGLGGGPLAGGAARPLGDVVDQVGVAQLGGRAYALMYGGVASASFCRERAMSTAGRSSACPSRRPARQERRRSRTVRRGRSGPAPRTPSRCRRRPCPQPTRQKPRSGQPEPVGPRTRCSVLRIVVEDGKRLAVGVGPQVRVPHGRSDQAPPDHRRLANSLWHSTAVPLPILRSALDRHAARRGQSRSPSRRRGGHPQRSPRHGSPAVAPDRSHRPAAW